jgi:hypothetical protein
MGARFFQGAGGGLPRPFPQLPNVVRGQQKQYEPGHLLGTWYLAVFQK